MFKKTVCYLLIVLFLNFLTSPALALTVEEKQREGSEEVKAQVLKRGVGEKARVKVTLLDQSKIQGFIQKVDEDSFVVIDRKTGEPKPISYSDVKKVQGPGLSRGKKIAIFVTAGVAAIAIVVYIAAKNITFSGPVLPL